MVDRRRYSSHARFRAPSVADRPSGLPQLYRGRAASSFKDLYETDHAESRQVGRFRWLVSTCLAGAVGAISIFVVIYGSADPRDANGGFLPALSMMGEADLGGRGMPFFRPSEGLKWATPKSDRLQVTSGAVTVRYLINEPRKQQRLGREYIHKKPYVRIVGRLAPVPSDFEEIIPSFNPLTLYATTKPASVAEESETETSKPGTVVVNVVELLGGSLPVEDGEELGDAEVAQHVEQAKQAEAEAEKIRAGAEADASRTAGGDDADPLGSALPEEAPPNTTVLIKPTQEAEDTLADLEGRQTLVVKVGDNDTLTKILTRAGADTWQARGMIEAARNIFPQSRLLRGRKCASRWCRRSRKRTARSRPASAFSPAATTT